MIDREEARERCFTLGASGGHTHNPELFWALETILKLYERIEELEDEAARVRTIVEEIWYTHNHWYDTARDEIGRSLFRIRFGPNFEEAP